MISSRPGRWAFLAVGAGAQFAAWLAVWRDVDAPLPPVWYVIEGVLAVVIGLLATDFALAAWTVFAGWGLVIAHFVAVVPKDENHNLWGAAAFFLLVLGGVAVCLALTTHLLSRRLRRRGEAVSRAARPGRR